MIGERGVIRHDAGGFGKAGNLVIANRIVKIIGQYIANNPIKAEFGITPRTN